MTETPDCHNLPHTVPEGDLAGQTSGGYLLGHLLRFGQLLRVMGMDVSTRQVLDLVEALEHVPIIQRVDFYHTCKALLVNRREDFLVFDQAFNLLWRLKDIPDEKSGIPVESQLERLRLPSAADGESGEGDAGDIEDKGHSRPGEVDEDGGETRSVPMMVYSAQEVSRTKDFGEMTWEEIQEAKQAIANMEWQFDERRTRRVRPSYKGSLHLRRMFRDNLRHGGEPIRLAFRRRVYRPRSLVVLCDISGSMERYSRMLLHFIHALTHGLKDTNVDAFVFGTRLTRITRYLRYKDVDESLDEVSDTVHDWSGGTRIGEALKTFNFQWTRRVLGGGAVVLVISDGWDRGDLQLLAREIHRLQRSAYRLIWLNPLLGSDDYRPVQRGMATVMPCIDDFLPVHNLASLDQLAEVLSAVTELRPVRKQRACAPEVAKAESAKDVIPSSRTSKPTLKRAPLA
ncbi:MAG: VWA domain-containing protein [Anaerolineae bacterium]|nr:VWA domain-containing protein [Anaerolineae bacterium]